MVTHGYMLNLDLNYEAVKKYIEISPKSFSQIGIVPFPKVVEARGQDQSIGSARPATTFLSITLTLALALTLIATLTLTLIATLTYTYQGRTNW